MKKQKIDYELKRISYLMNTFDKLEHQLNCVSRDLGERTLKRIMHYLAARYSWFFDWFKEK